MRTSAHKTWAAVAFAAIVTLPGTGISADTLRYPTKPIRVINPFTAGGSVDIVARVTAQKMNEAWGQPAIVDNRPGAGATIGAAIVARAAPDGYTLLVTTGTMAVNVSLYRKLPFDAVKDFAPVALLVQTPNVLAVHPSVAAKTTQELIALAKAKPGEIRYASSGAGTSTHLTMELFRSLANIEMLHVAYKGATPAVGALLSGEVQAIFNPITAILPQARAGRVRALAVSSGKRVEVAPDIPTVAESGVPGFESIVWYACFAPAGTPRGVVTRINAEINRFLQEADTRDHFLKIGMVPMGGTPEAAADYLKLEIARWAKVVKDAGISTVD